MRGEYLSSTRSATTKAGFGVSGRLSAEIFASGVGIEPRGLFLGTYAMGVYVEAGARQMVDGVNAFQATVGLTFRTPLVFAFGSPRSFGLLSDQRPSRLVWIVRIGGLDLLELRFDLCEVRALHSAGHLTECRAVPP